MTLKILNEFRGTEATDNCGGPLGAGQFCARRIAIDNAGAYACIATAGSTTNLRGALTLEENSRVPPVATSCARSAPRRCGRRGPAGARTVLAGRAHGRWGPPWRPCRVREAAREPSPSDGSRRSCRRCNALRPNCAVQRRCPVSAWPLDVLSRCRHAASPTTASGKARMDAHLLGFQASLNLSQFVGA